MKSKWKVYLALSGNYGVYRLKDVDEPDIMGNREFGGAVFNLKRLAEDFAKRLNREGEE